MGLFDFLTRPGGWSGLPAVKAEQPMPRVIGGAHEVKFTGLIDDFRAALTVNTLVHGPGASGSLWRGGDANSAVFACLLALSKGYIEPPLRVFQKLPDGKREHLPDHPLQLLLDRPNPFHNLLEVGWWVAWAKHCDGNAYLRKVRAGNADTGNVVQLWPISPSKIEPISSGRDYLTAYKYEYATGKFELIPPHNMVHYRLGVDPRDDRLGLAPLKRLIREIASDDEATKFTESLMANGAFPGLVVTADKDAEISRDQAEDLKARVQAMFGNDRRGSVGVLAPGAKMEQFGFSPEQLNLEALHAMPESRICAVMGVPPAVVGLMIGLQQTSNYASMREVREMFTENTLSPEWVLDAAKLNHQLVPDFDRRGGIEVAFDLSDVRALQEDMNTRYTRLNTAVQGGWVLPNEARQEVGFEPLPQFDQPAEPAEAVPPALRIVKALEAKSFNPDALGPLFEALSDLAEPQFKADMEGFLDAQRRAVRAKLAGG